MSEITGKNTLEVWDYLLSTAHPTLYNNGETWTVKLRSNKTGKVLLEHDTKVKVEHGDTYDYKKIKACFEWLKSVRDQFARPDIEELKPVVAFGRLMKAQLHELLRDKDKRQGAIITATYFADMEYLMEQSK